MTTKNLSSVATAVIESYGNTAMNMIHAYRLGGQRVIGFVDQRFEAVVNAGGIRLGDELRTNLIGTEKGISSYTTRGLQFGVERAETTVGAAVELANKGVVRIAANAERFDQATNFGALDMLNRVALPAAKAVSEVVVRIEEGSSQLLKRVTGKSVVAKTAAKQAKAAKKVVAKTVKKVGAVKTAMVRKTAVVARKTRSAAAKAVA